MLNWLSHPVLDLGSLGSKEKWGLCFRDPETSSG